MSKRKRKEGHEADLAARASKKVKPSKAESSEAHKETKQRMSSSNISEGTVSGRKAEKEAKRKAKRERRKVGEKSKKSIQVAVQEEVTKDGAKVVPGEVKHKVKKKKQKKSVKPAGWKVSDAVGGFLLDLDPVFSDDEQYLLLAYESAICVYATSTSVRVRTMSPSTTYGEITGFALSASNPTHVYISLNQGLIEKWNWTLGHRLCEWAIKSQISNIATTMQNADHFGEDTVFTIDFTNKKWMITAYRLPVRGESSGAQKKTLLNSSDSIAHLRVLQSGKVLIASSGQRLMVGIINGVVAAPSLKDMVYTWREVPCREWITCLDAQIEDDHDAKGTETTSKSTNMQKAVDIVIGGLHGSIFVYRDLLGDLIQIERKKHIRQPAVQHLHWHRNAVGAVRWSADGNYILSGGIETVMILWQLDTGQKQFLPHLSAPIESLVVSPSGSSYAVRIADNSAMVLSTAELQPTVSVSGIQLETFRSPLFRLPKVTTVSEPTKVTCTSRRPAAAVTRTSPNQILLAVPGSSSSRSGSTHTSNAAYLQTFDARSGTQVSRQALTRTKVTDRNIGPQSNVIEEPNVVLLQTSLDGKWLATVEEWTPPRQDIGFLALDRDSTNGEQNSRMEVYLKFWLWDDASKNWELVSRIDSPHYIADADVGPVGRVFDLIVDPSSSGFVTIGDEGLVKIWKPKTRLRDGLKVKGNDGRTLTSWSCRQAIPLTALDVLPGDDDDYITARLAISSDGSVLVAGYHSSSTSLLYVIDTKNSHVKALHSNIFSGSIVGLGIIDRYLIIFADSLVVWDIVDDRINYEISIAPSSLLDRNRVPMSHLALDQEAGTYAVAIPEIGQTGGGTRLKSQFAIFSPNLPTPLYTKGFPRALAVLLPSVQRGGYLTIDTAVEVRTVTQAAILLHALPKENKGVLKSPSNLENIYVSGFGVLLAGKKDGQAATSLIAADSGHNGGPLPDYEDSFVIRQHELTRIFDRGHSLALPSVTDLFEQVAGLFCRKLPVIS